MLLQDRVRELGADLVHVELDETIEVAVQLVLLLAQELELLLVLRHLQDDLRVGKSDKECDSKSIYIRMGRPVNNNVRVRLLSLLRDDGFRKVPSTYTAGTHTNEMVRMMMNPSPIAYGFVLRLHGEEDDREGEAHAPVLLALSVLLRDVDGVLVLAELELRVLRAAEVLRAELRVDGVLLVLLHQEVALRLLAREDDLVFEFLLLPVARDQVLERDRSDEALVELELLLRDAVLLLREFLLQLLHAFPVLLLETTACTRARGWKMIIS